MDFRIADTFTTSLAHLTNDEQKAVKTTAFDLQMNPAAPGNNFHKLDKAKDKNFWSVRVNLDLRLIVHRTDASLLLCYVDHHDKAYAWAERRKLETHPKTGAAQWVEIRETVQKIVVPEYVPAAPTKRQGPKADKPLFDKTSDDDLLALGVPAEWLGDVHNATENTLFDLADRLPAEAVEALLILATSGKPAPKPAPVGVKPFDHPDAQRRFRVVNSVEELALALDYPWDKWSVFLHPEQRELVGRDYNGPARVAGSAGTGKTIVALHRAVFLARKHTEARVLLATFSESLASALRVKLRRLVARDPRVAERVEVFALDTLGLRLHKARVGEVKLATPEVIAKLVALASAAVPGHKFKQRFLLTEWDQVVDAWQLQTWDAYRDVPRLGRRTRVSESQRAALWAIAEKVRAALAAQGLSTMPMVYQRLTETLGGKTPAPFEYAVVDEAQDLSVAQLRLLAALGAGRPDALFFAGDVGQRIFQQPFSWKALGVDVRGRSRTLRVNYRTSHQIREHADRLLGPELADGDENVEARKDTVSVFNGPPPELVGYHSAEEEQASVGAWLASLSKGGFQPGEMAVVVRSDAELPRAEAAARASGLEFKRLAEETEDAGDRIAVSTMHLAKGLEYRAVAVMACDSEIPPVAAADRVRGRRRRPGGGLRDRAPPPVRSLHASARPPPRDERDSSL